MDLVSSKGHHSAKGRAIEAHRQQVEDRQMRKLGKEFAAFQAAQPNTQYLIGGQVTDQNGQATAAADTNPEEQKEDKYNAPMLEPATSFAKSASVWSFQNTEPGKPSTNDPIPKGSYLDVQG